MMLSRCGACLVVSSVLFFCSFGEAFRSHCSPPFALLSHGKLIPILRLQQEGQSSSKKHLNGKTLDKKNKQTTRALTQLRGGGVGGIVVTLLQTAVRNPILVALIGGSVVTRVFAESIPHANKLQGLLQFALVCYFFYLFVQWQQMHQEAANES